MKTERESEVEAAIENGRSAIAEARLKGVRYASSAAGDGATLVALLELEDDGWRNRTWESLHRRER